jgi:hypothetical protein
MSAGVRLDLISSVIEGRGRALERAKTVRCAN